MSHIPSRPPHLSPSRLKCSALVVLLLLQVVPHGFAQRGKGVVKLLDVLAKGVSYGSAAATIYDVVGAAMPPLVSEKLDLGSREGMFSSKMVISLHNKTADTVTGITIDYTVGGNTQRFTVGNVAPGQTKEFGWLQGAPMIQTGDTIAVNCDGARSKAYHF